jgi:hypothetical protein
MTLLEDQTVAFIVRIWRERSECESQEVEWRGSIEHVSSGQKAFFRNLEAIAEFMRPHLEAIGIDATLRFWERMSEAVFENADQPARARPDPEPDYHPKRNPANRRARKRG